MGSSPLTRGKLGVRYSVHRVTGLIPAHAGKTSPVSTEMVSHRAHPRSRGENHELGCKDGEGMGSSPLTRGKLLPSFYPPVKQGLIPAHAGKTFALVLPACQVRAHPRSRGENHITRDTFHLTAGSSPLTRGKPNLSVNCVVGCGLIPAHAGKTLPDLRFYRADRSDLGKP